MASDSEYLWNPDAPMRQYLGPKLRGGGGGGGSATPHGDAYAALTRQSWYDYMNTLGVPQENKLIQYATDPTVISGSMSEASRDATGAFDRQQVATDRRLSGLGLTLTAEERGAADRSSNLARSLADVGAQNRARDQTIARQQSILGSPAPSIGALRP